MKTSFKIEIEEFASPDRNIVVSICNNGTNNSLPVMTREDLANLGKTIIDYLSKE